MLIAPAANGTIVNGLDGAQNTVSPPNFPYWNNIGYVPFGISGVGGSGIYLGDGWVLTAEHVQGGSSGGYTFVIPKLNNGQDAVFTPQFASQVQMHLGGGGSDLALFRLQDDALLHSLPNVQFGDTPPLNTKVTIIGAGYNRDPTEHFWHLADPAHPDTTTWTDVTSSPNVKSLANRAGYIYAAQPSFAKRWGINSTVAVPGGGSTFIFNNTQLFATVFNDVTNGSQVAPGDSGGGVFANNRLIGLNLYKGDDSKDPANPNNVGQPANTAVFGNASFFANLRDYVDEIAGITKLHPSIDGDANLDGAVDGADFNILYSNLGTGTTWTQGDFNLDGRVDFSDFQRLELNFGMSTSAISDTLPVAAVFAAPEPGCLGVAALAMALVFRRPRRIG